MIDLAKVIEAGLIATGYDGLFIAGCCACKIGDIAPCGDVSERCEPGILTFEECENCPCDFHIGNGAPHKYL